MTRIVNAISEQAASIARSIVASGLGAYGTARAESCADWRRCMS